MTKSTWGSILLIFSLVSVVLFPLLGSLTASGGLPPGYGEFPSQKVMDPPGFVPEIFWAGAAFGLVILALYAFPRVFGFKKVVPPSGRPEKIPGFPSWFWWGAGIFPLSLGTFMGKIPFLDILDPFLFLPIWWSVILMLDGWVFRRKGGTSLLSTKPQTMILLALISSIGWFIFEYLDFFILENWYYPNNRIFTPYGNIVWFLLSYTIIFPQLFELVQLLETFPRFYLRYSLGPKVPFSRGFYIFLVILGILLSFLMGMFPRPLFFTVWINPVLIMTGVLGFLGVPQVFSPLRSGNWAPLLVSGLAMVLCGLGWELVNFGSEFFFGYQPVNPSYWKYSVPYVNDIHLPHTEMPLLGYLGYIPYAWACWLQWDTAGALFGFSSQLDTGKGSSR